MQRAIGLPTPDRTLGQQAHDFAQALGAREVILTRAQFLDGAPARPSRWWLRLETLLRATKTPMPDTGTRAWVDWASALHRPNRVQPVRRPAPRPPVSLRPRSLSVTEIETWVRDPYSLYARHILKLRPLDPLDADADAAERGQFIHTALDAFVRAFPSALPEDALAQLLAFGEKAYGDRLARPDIRAFWWPRFERIAAWFVEGEATRRRTIEKSETEIRGRRSFDAPAGEFTLRAKADRIDRLRNGAAIIIDYKTGTVPADRDIQSGFAPQLPLEGWIAEGGGFGESFAVHGYALEHWKLSGGEPAGLVMPVKGDMTSLIEEAGAGLAALVARFDHASTPYTALPRPSREPRFPEYAHLARRDEWRQADPEAS
jgi:ATP-dependent helicase/nuclease subunit B